MSDDTRRSRRLFLAALGAAGAGSLLHGLPSAAQTPGTPARRIDIHQHFVSPGFYATLNSKNATAPIPGLAAWKGYSPASAVEALDRVGIATAMLSITAPGVWFGDVQEARKLAREMNEYAAGRLVSDYKNRFGLFAALPLPDVEGSLKEIEYAFDTLKADGISLITSYDGKWLGDPSFDPVFQELNRRKAVVFTHPLEPPCCRNPLPGVRPTTLEYPTDTTRAIMNLLVTDAATRHPDVRFIFSHAGGTLVSIAQRILGNDVTAESLGKPVEKDSRLYHLRRFHYDTAGSANPVQLQSLKLLVPASQIVFGTDTPLASLPATVVGVRTSGLSVEEQRGIYRDNLLQILPDHTRSRIESA